jgi:plastocyanin
MTRHRLLPAIALAGAAAAILAASAAARTGATPTLNGSDGPGFTVGLTMGGKKVTSLKPGTYKLVVADKSNIHNFHITGPGLNKVVTTVPFTGTKTVTVTLKKGTYKYVCDAHVAFMHGSFKVT